ncbi:MAG: glycoside hydrolase family 26 protein [Trebonia sp.]
MVKLAAMGVAVSLACTGCLSLTTASPQAKKLVPGRAAPVRPLRPVPTPARPLVGVYEPAAPSGWSQIAEFARATAIQPKVVAYYSSWNSPFDTSFAQSAWAHHAYALVQLQPNDVTLTSIANGASDAYLRSYARAVVAFGHPVILSFGHEMNGDWYSWGNGHASPAAFVAAWRHIVRLFRAAGASNATWLWTVNSIAGASNALRQWWPGSAWVDWTGIDGYFYGAADTFGTVLGPTIADIRSFSDAPLLIAETAVGTTKDRDSQIDGLLAGVRDAHLAGLIWFDVAQHDGLYHQDWRLEDDADALAAFTKAVATYLSKPHRGHRSLAPKATAS